MRRAPVRTLLALDLLAVASVIAALVLAVGLPLGARRGLPPHTLVALVLGAAAVGTVLGTLLLWRAVARPVERMLEAAQRLGRVGELPVLGEEDGAGLSRASVVFERVVVALQEDRAQLAAQVAELERADRALDDAHVRLDRSERLATMGRLAAGLAHEIGNPLGAVTGYAELARARLPAEAHPELRDALGRIADAAERIDGILRQLLDFARPALARIGEVPLPAVIDVAVRLARVQPRFRRVEVALDLPPELPPVRADEQRLAQVLLNLLLNAADAMGGAGRVEISGRAQGGAVEVRVADGGPGIAAAHLPHLFEPFFTTKSPGEGTGLGLATSRQIVESFQGSIQVANRPAGGAEFTIRLLCPTAMAGGPT